MTKFQKTVLGISLAVAAFIICDFGYTEISKRNERNRKHDEYNQFITLNSTFFDNTTINGMPIGGLSIDEAADRYIEQFETNTIFINSTVQDEPAKFVFKDLNIDYTKFRNELTEIFLGQDMSEAEYYKTEEPLKRDYTYDLISDIDEKNIDFSSVSFLSEENITDSEDASVIIDSKLGTVSVENETTGNRLQPGVFEKKLDNAIKKGISEVYLTEEDYIKPSVYTTDDSITEKVEYYKAIFNKTITLNVCGVTDKLDSSRTREFYSFDKDNNVTINDAKISEYVSSLEKMYNTYGTPRTFHTSTGKDVVVEKNLYGWLINHDNTCAVIKDALESLNAKEKVKAKYNHIGRRPATDEISNTYIEVSIDDQHVWMYKDGECILSTVCVTGELTNPDMWTHKGVYFLINTATDCVLKGPDYRYDVSYWVYFDRANAIGFHDATWRDPSEFAPTTYNGNGSHGCVNLPLDAIATMYNNIDMDEPVIVW